MNRWIGRTVAAISLALTACVLAPERAPTEEISRATRAVQNAQSAQVREIAPLDIRLAEEKLIRSQALVETTDPNRYPQARRLADQAWIDARIAHARTTLHLARREQAALQRQVDELAPPQPDLPREGGSAP